MFAKSDAADGSLLVVDASVLPLLYVHVTSKSALNAACLVALPYGPATAMV